MDTLAIGTRRAIAIAANCRFVATGLAVAPGERYQFTVLTDGTPANRRAHATPDLADSPFPDCHLYGCVGAQDRHAFVIHPARDWIVPHAIVRIAEPQLYLFANDGRQSADDQLPDGFLAMTVGIQRIS